MRVRTFARREAILEAARQVFEARGFKRANMSEIADATGASKPTLYGYFSSKEALFAAAVARSLRERADRAFAKLDETADVRAKLVAFAREYLCVRLTSDTIGADRVMISEAGRSDLGLKLRKELIEPEWRKFADALAREMTEGRLRDADPWLAALHFRGLIEADLVERRLHGADAVEEPDIEAAAQAGTEAFLRAYGP